MYWYAVRVKHPMNSMKKHKRKHFKSLPKGEKRLHNGSCTEPWLTVWVPSNCRHCLCDFLLSKYTWCTECSCCVIWSRVFVPAKLQFTAFRGVCILRSWVGHFGGCGLKAACCVVWSSTWLWSFCTADLLCFILHLYVSDYIYHKCYAVHMVSTYCLEDLQTF